MIFVIILTFTLASDIHGQGTIERTPPMLSLEQCESVREVEAKNYRNTIEKAHGEIVEFDSKCEAPGMPV